MIFVYLIGAVIAILFGSFYLYKRRIMKYVGHLPSLPEIPIVGAGAYFLGKNSIEIMDMLCMVTDMLETPCRVWLGPVLTIILGKPEDIQTVLLSPKCLEKPYVYRFMEVSKGLLTAPVHVWKLQRKLLNPTFNKKILLSFIPIFNEQSKILADVLGNKVGEKAFDVSHEMFACTLEMICSTSFGVPMKFQGKNHIDILDAIEGQSKLVADRMAKFWLHPQFIYKWTDAYKDFRRRYNCIHEIPGRIRKIKEKEFYESNYFEKAGELKEDEYFSTPQIFINELIKIRHRNLIDDEMVNDILVTMLIGGNETSALATSHTVLMLAMHPKIQEKAFEEIKNAHQSQTSDTDAEIIPKLDYLERCIKETMRLYPVAPFLARKNTDDIKLSNCTVPKGTLLLLSFYYLHRNKEVWGPNADIFDPDNFLPEKVASRHPYNFLPFSGGSRNCIGMKYSWISMKTMLSAVLRQYKFSTHLRHEDIIIKFEASLKIENRALVTIERRQPY